VNHGQVSYLAKPCRFLLLAANRKQQRLHAHWRTIMRAITVDAYGEAEAGITFFNESFGFVPFESFRVPLHRNLADGIIAAHAVMVRNHTTLAGELVSRRTRLVESAPEVADASHWAGKRRIDGGAHDFLAKFSSELTKLSAGTTESRRPETVNPLPLRFYRAELAKTSKGGPLLVPERDMNDQSLLVLFSSGVGYKQTLRVKGPEGKVLASGFSRGFKRTMQTMLVWLEPGDEMEVRMSGSTNTQAVGFERSYTWDGAVLSLHQSRSSGRNGSDKFYGEDGVKTRIIPADLELKEQAAEQAVYAALATLVANRTTRDAQAAAIRQQQQALLGASSSLAEQLEALKAEAAPWMSLERDYSSSYYSGEQFKAWQPSIYGDLTQESLQKAKAEFAQKLNELERDWFKAKDARAEQRYAEAIAEANVLEAKRLEEEAEALRADALAFGCPSDVRIWRRRGGRTNAGDGWVIRPDGTEREPDRMECPRPRYPSEGTQVWHQILPGEIVLKWSKDSSAAPHDFEVLYRQGELTAAQLHTVELLQGEIDQDWETARGLASGILSPGIGDGWGLLPKKKPKPEPVVTPVAQGGQRASQDALAALRAQFAR